MDIFWGHHKSGLYLGVISMHFMVFQGTEWGIFFWVAKMSNIFWGCLQFLKFLGVDAGPEPTYVKKMRVHPPPPCGLTPVCSASRPAFFQKRN